MNVCVNTVVTTFDLTPEVKLQCYASRGARGKKSSSNTGFHCLNLELLAQSCWNVELKRSKSLEATYCTMHLPPTVVGDGKFVLLNGVVSIRGSGCVHVLASGTSEGTRLLAEEVRAMLTRIILSDPWKAIPALSSSRPCSVNTEDPLCTVMNGDEAAKEAELLQRYVFQPSASRENSSMSAKACHSSAAPSHPSPLHEEKPLFTPATIKFTRVAVYPVRKYLQQLRTAAQWKAPVNPQELQETFSCMELEGPSIRPSTVRSSTVRLNVHGDEAIEFVRVMLGDCTSSKALQADAASFKEWIEKDLTQLSELCQRKSSNVSTEYIREVLVALRGHIVPQSAKVQRLAAGLKIELMWLQRTLLGDQAPSQINSHRWKPEEAQTLESNASAYHVNLSSENFASGSALYNEMLLESLAVLPDDPLIKPSESTEALRATSEGVKQRGEKRKREEASLAWSDEAMFKVECQLFSSGRGTLASKSTDAILFVIQRVIIPLLVMHAEF